MIQHRQPNVKIAQNCASSKIKGLPPCHNFMYMYTHVHVCMHECVCVPVCVLCVYICVFKCVCVNLFTMHVHKQVHVVWRVCACMCVCVCVCV